MDIWPVIEEELERYRYCTSIIRLNLSVYEDECIRLIGDVSKSSFDEAQEAFESLHAIQQKISTIKYKYEFPLNDRWLNFVYHLDRDDIYSRAYWYERFKNGLKWPDD